MKFTERLLKNQTFLQTMHRVREFESDRIYCHHELEHALDVARIAWIYWLEEHTIEKKEPMEVFEPEEVKDLIYISALLHDIGRAAQYETGIHHSITGVGPAAEILDEIGFPEEKRAAVLSVVAGHCERPSAEEEALLQYIARADHDCRLCFFCSARESCKWSDEERNRTVKS